MNRRAMKEQSNFTTTTSDVVNKNNSGQAQHQNKFDAGQAMVEAMVAMSIIVIGLLGVFTLSSSSISLNKVAADRYIAVNLAGEGIELVKNLIDNNPWNEIPGFDLSLSPNGNYEIDFNDLKLKISEERTLFFSKGDISKSGSGYYAYDNGDSGDLDESYIETIQNFTRIMTIENISDEHIKVISTVSWKAKDGSMLNFSVEDHFYNLKF
mgnify:FL=1